MGATRVLHSRTRHGDMRPCWSSPSHVILRAGHVVSLCTCPHLSSMTGSQELRQTCGPWACGERPPRKQNRSSASTCTIFSRAAPAVSTTFSAHTESPSAFSNQSGDRRDPEGQAQAPGLSDQHGVSLLRILHREEGPSWEQGAHAHPRGSPGPGQRRH